MPADVAVLDASAAVELLLATARGEEVDRLLRASLGVLAPAHLDAEVLSALARLVRAGHVPAHTVEDALDDLADMPLTRVPLPPLLRDAWALRGNISARDALYVAVAQRAAGTLITADAKLARAVETQRLAGVQSVA